MSEIAIQRCVLRIRRTAGWAWGASPDALLAAATRALPELIASRLPALVREGVGEITITEPLRVHITGSVAELVTLADMTSTGAATTSSGLAMRIAAAVDAAVARALADASARMHVDGPARYDHELDTKLADVTDVEHAPPAVALRLLERWSARGALRAILDALDDRALIALHDLVLPSIAGVIVSEPARALIADLAGRVVMQRDGERAILSRRLEIAAVVRAREPTIPRHELRAALDVIEPLPSSPAARFPEGDADIETDDAAPALSPAARAAAAPTTELPVVTTRTVERELRQFDVPSALPFLLLPSLHHAGWIDALATAAAIHELPERALAALAVGLAAKAIDPPERGWMRRPEHRALLRAFAGRDVDDAEVRAATTALDPVFTLLDTTMRSVLASPSPVALWRTGSHWLAIDLDGCCVIAGPAELGSLLRVVSERLLVVPAAAADRGVLDRIDLANARFVTDAPPGRAEPWRALAGGDRRLWTNETTEPAGSLIARAGDLTMSLALVEELIEQLVQRPAIPRDPVHALEATCTLAATAALSDLGARLFPDERGTPVLALTRFRDLDARVTFDDDLVSVRIPLGRRHADLMRHGFLTTIPAVPWLGGRAVDLGGA